MHSEVVVRVADEKKAARGVSHSFSQDAVLIGH